MPACTLPLMACCCRVLSRGCMGAMADPVQTWGAGLGSGWGGAACRAVAIHPLMPTCAGAALTLKAASARPGKACAAPRVSPLLTCSATDAWIPSSFGCGRLGRRAAQAMDVCRRTRVYPRLQGMPAGQCGMDVLAAGPGFTVMHGMERNAMSCAAVQGEPMASPWQPLPLSMSAAVMCHDGVFASCLFFLCRPQPGPRPHSRHPENGEDRCPLVS